MKNSKNSNGSLFGTIATATLLLIAHPGFAQKASVSSTKTSAQIHPFHVKISESALTDFRKRIQMTNFPDQETVPDQSQGAQLSNMKELVKYWGTGYDWRKAEAKLNAYPQFITKIDGLDIHFIHVKSKHKNAMPLILSHGWPGSVFEFTGVIDPLTNPTVHGGKAEDAFDLIIPSLPGFGFSGKPTEGGWNNERIAKAWIVLMDRLGYKHYVAQGGDWGAGIVHAMALLAPQGLLGYPQ